MRDLSWSASFAILCALFLFVCAIVCLILAAREERKQSRLPPHDTAADRDAFRDVKGSRR